MERQKREPHQFGHLVTYYRQQTKRGHGFSQAALAYKANNMDPTLLSRMCRGDRLVGETARSYILEIIYVFYTEEVLSYVNQANDFLVAASQPILGSYQSIPKEKLLLNELIEEQEPVISLAPSLRLENMTLAAIATELDEWKIVHMDVQKLLIESIRWEKKFLRFILNPTNSGVTLLSDDWHENCEPQARRVRISLENLQTVNNRLVDELQIVLKTRDKCVPYHIDHLYIEQPESQASLERAFLDYKLLLIESLDAADIAIRNIAHRIKFGLNSPEH